jgi:phage terminase large subunit-like protein
MKADLNFECKDWADRLRDHQMPIDLAGVDRFLNEKRVNVASKAFGMIRCPDVPGQPQMDVAAATWQKEVVKLAAGGLQADGRQSINSIGVMVPKKNSKTTFASAMALTLAMMSPRPNAEFLLIGAEQSIAQLSFQQLQGMIACDDELREHWHVREHLKKIVSRKSGVTISVKSFSMEAVTGTKPALVLLDEAHLLTHADAGRVVGQLRGGMAAIPEGQLIWISTQSDVTPRGFWKDELEKARSVRDGKLQLPGYAPILYEPPPEFTKDLIAASDPKMWSMVNPSLGYSITEEWLVRSFREAVSTSEHETRRWLSQHANVEVAAFEFGDNAWGGAEVWLRGKTEDLTFEQIVSGADRIVIGLDGGGLDDLLAVTVLGIFGDEWKSATRAFIYPVVLQRRLQISSLLQDFSKSGDLVIMDEFRGLDDVIELIASVALSRPDVIVAADPNGVAMEISEALQEAGVSQQNIVAVRQGWGLRVGYQALERRLRAGTLQHADQQIMDWCVSNSMVDVSGLVTKKISGHAKIDCLVALAIASVAAMEQPAAFDVDAMVG